MPKVEIDYSNTIIYKITCKDPNITDVYVGHTTNFIQRKHAHKQCCINNKSSNYNCKLYQVIRNNGGWTNWSMEIVNFFNCKDHYEARKKEQEYFELLHATLNSIEPMPKPKVKPEKGINDNIPNLMYDIKICNIKNENATTNAQNAQDFFCNMCDYKCSRSFDMKRHYNTNKHKINKMATDDAKKTKFSCEYCEKKFNDRSGLWRHKKKCEIIKNENIIINVDETTTNNQSGDHDFDSEMMLEILKQNQEFKDLILEQNKKILELVSTVNITNNNITNNMNNTTNNKFNLNVFLNETCKDALNLSDFLESLILTLTDFENFGPLGYCGGISNILVNGLNKLDISKRPIHCSDLKREVIHIKNNDIWHKDDDKQQMIKVIKAIEHKNIKQMSLWGRANPEYKDPNHKKSDLYTKLIDQSLCDTDKEKAQKNYNKIIRTVAKEILVDKN